jgi:putative ABC transport system permease protein
VRKRHPQVLGASRRDIVQQFLVESLLLATAGGVIGLLLSLWQVEGLTVLLPADVPHLSGLTPDVRVLLFTCGAALLTGVLCGLCPAFTATRGDLANTIKDGGRSATGHALGSRLRNVLVVGEIALALTLLVAAGFLPTACGACSKSNPALH